MGSHRRRKRRRLWMDRLARVEPLEPRRLLALDFGDAPDPALGTGAANYQTTAADGGPSHTIVAGLKLGASVDMDDGARQNAAANADDVDGALPDDEDGVFDASDLMMTIGAMPRVRLRATNATGAAATLFGWIDVNADGVFENATERAQLTVPDGSDNAIFTLAFGVVPPGFTGTTYARFRLSTDTAAANPFGTANDGEVEDYVVRITSPTHGAVQQTVKIADGANGGPSLADFDDFGRSLAAIGDVDGDGVIDLAVGATGDDTGGVGSNARRGAVHLLFLNDDGSVKSSAKIDNDTPNAPVLVDLDYFGHSVASLGDLDGDGVTDLAVGAGGDDTGGDRRGAVHVLFLNANGSVKHTVKIADGASGGPGLADFDFFGRSLAAVGDLDGDGLTDLAVGAYGDNSGGVNRGAVYLLFLNSDGTVKSLAKIDDNTLNGPILADFDVFGYSVAALGDLDGNGVTEIAVGASGDDTGGGSRGAVHILYLNADGSVKQTVKIASGLNGGPSLADFDGFGRSLSSLGDIDADGVADVAVGATGDDTGGGARGAAYVLFLNADGMVKHSVKTAHFTNGGPALVNGDAFGRSIASLGDLNGDGRVDLAVGADGDNTGGGDRGAVHLLFLGASVDYGDAPDSTTRRDEDGDGVDDGVDLNPHDATINIAAPSYNTLSANNGPSHAIVEGLHLGAAVYAGADGQPTFYANGDSLERSPPGDEDGVIDPQDLHLAVGTTSHVRLRATNLTGNDATLFGWIDFNADGLFDNATERAQIAVPDGADNETFTLIFGALPSRLTGTTYARFRLSTDAAAANPTGAASDGEVEDYAVSITTTWTEQLKETVKIADSTLGGPTLADEDFFGRSVAFVGDLDDDGVVDLAVGAPADDEGGDGRGAVHLLLLNRDGSVKQTVKIASGLNGAPVLADGDFFGHAVASLGDLDGDGVSDLAVGAVLDGTGGTYRGAVHVLLLNADGTVKSARRIDSSTAGAPALADNDYFGNSITSLGDFDGDGVGDIAVGATGDDTAGADTNRGAVYVVLLQADGRPKSSFKIASETGGGPTLADGDFFGGAVTSLGDLDGDGVTDLAVGAHGNDEGGVDAGSVYVLLMNSDATVKQSIKIAHNLHGGPSLTGGDEFGVALHTLGDLDGDGVVDLAVGATGEGNDRGAVHVLLLNADGTVKQAFKIDSNTTGGPSLVDSERFGRSLAAQGDVDGDGITEIVAGAYLDDTGGADRGAVHVVFLKPLLFDFADAPDATTGRDRDADFVDDGVDVNPGDAAFTLAAPSYNTLAANSGPSHRIVAGLMLGSNVDHDADGAPTFQANGDDLVADFPDDEDGLVDPVDLQLTAGTTPRVRLRATNLTGADATLTGWIDYNADGVFDNADERAQITVAAGSDNDVFTLTFGVVPTVFAGTTYARFRLSTDPAAADPTGIADDGEVEDHVVAISAISSLAVKRTVKIANDNFLPGGPVLADFDQFGGSVVSLGDLDGDGVTDLAVGAPYDDSVFFSGGAVYVLFRNADGSVREAVKIANRSNGGPADAAGAFGSSLAVLGDLDGDGVVDLAVGAWGDDTGPGSNAGALHILFLNADGTVKQSVKTDADTVGGPVLGSGDYFGRSVASLGDLDGDGVVDIAVGASGDDGYYGSNTRSGAVHILLLNADGSVKQATEINNWSANGPFLSTDDRFGQSVTALGDLDGDGVVDIAVGAPRNNTGGSDAGAVHVLLLTAAGSVKQTITIVDGTANGPDLSTFDRFGNSVASLGDLDGDGAIELAVGAYLEDIGGGNRGAVYVLSLNADGSVKQTAAIAHETGGGPSLANLDQFGSAVAGLGDLDGDGIADLAVGANRDATGGYRRGAVYVLNLNADATVKQAEKIAHVSNVGSPLLADYDFFGSAVAPLGDLNGDGVEDLAVAADGDAGGAVHVLFMNEDGTVNHSSKIHSFSANLDDISTSDGFAYSLASLGDLDGDGIADLAVGAPSHNYENPYGGTISDTGALHVLFLDAGGGVKSHVEIEYLFPSSPFGNPAGARFGSSVTTLGDLDGDGVTDIAVGASRYNGLGNRRGAVYVLFMNADGTHRSSVEISDITEPGLMLSNNDYFGRSVASLGDIDGDGVTDLAVGARNDDTGGTGTFSNLGAVYVLLLQNDGGVKEVVKIADETNGGPSLSSGDFFGTSLAALGDLDGDGVTDIAVGAPGDDTGGVNRGMVHVLSLNPDGTVKQTLEIAHRLNGGPDLADIDNLGNSLSSVGDLDGDGVTELAIGAEGDDTGGDRRGAVYVLFLDRPTDYGDAPDATTGLDDDADGVDNGVDLNPDDPAITIAAPSYNTRLANNGPSHRIVEGLHLGAVVDAGSPELPGFRASGDDGERALPNDEDGVVDAADLILTVGTMPAVRLRATNLTAADATLSGWMDFNADGLFDNATERAQASVPAGADNQLFTLTFGAVPDVFTGGTYARFRLSTDAAAANPTGAAIDGEVEDHRATIVDPSPGGVSRSTRIVDDPLGGPRLADLDLFGSAAAPLGDLDGDGVIDLVVGADGDNTGDFNRGAVYVLLMNADGSVRKSVKIAGDTNGGPSLAAGDAFGSSLALLGDLDGDGVVDLAVGARGDDAGGSSRGAVHLLFLNADGTVKQSIRIDDTTANGPVLADLDYFGASVARLGDLDGDGMTELAVGAWGDDTGADRAGAVHVLFLNADGTVKQTVKIDTSTVNGPGLASFDRFGRSVASLGDRDGDGRPELAVGAIGDSAPGFGDRGAVYLLYLNADGSLKQTVKVDEETANGPTLVGNDRFGYSLALLGDLDGDGAKDLLVGADLDDSGGVNRGAVHVLLLNTDGTLKQSVRISDDSTNGPQLADHDVFGRSAAALGDLDGDGVIDVAVGAPLDDTGGSARGAVHVLLLDADASVKQAIRIAGDVDGGPRLQGGDQFGAAVAPLGDLNGDGVGDVAVGSPGDDEGGDSLGALHVVFLNADGSAKQTVKIGSATNGGPVILSNGDRFGASVASRGDVDGDGLADLVVGLPGDDTGGVDRGAVYLLFLEADGTVKRRVKVAHELNGGPSLADGVEFGGAAASLGDLDGDGVADVAVGAPLDGDAEAEEGAVYVLFMNASGSVKSHVKISDGLLGFAPVGLEAGDQFGSALASLGDLDGDGVTDLAVGAAYDENDDSGEGAVYVLLMNADGSVKGHTKISDGLAGFAPVGLDADDHFGSSLTSLGDLDGDGVTDLAVGASGDENGDAGEGAVYLLLLNADGTVKSHQKVADGLGRFAAGALGAGDALGSSLANLGDINGDGAIELAVGASFDENQDEAEGALYVLSLLPLDDFGDAPDTYRTTLAAGPNGGARHTNVGVQLGELRDGELDAPALLDGGGDDAHRQDDDDGVTISTLAALGLGQITVTIAGSAGDARLYGWIDYNGDGDFLDDGEQIAAGDGASANLADGSHTFIFDVPDTGFSGPTFARFRVSTDAALSFDGAAMDGEVEDYTVTILPPSTFTKSGNRYDVDDDGDNGDIQDIIALINELRANGAHSVPGPPGPAAPPPYLDVDGNHVFEVADIISLVRHLRSAAPQEGEPSTFNFVPGMEPIKVGKETIAAPVQLFSFEAIAASTLYADSSTWSRPRIAASKFDMPVSPPVSALAGVAGSDVPLAKTADSDLEATLRLIASVVSDHWKHTDEFPYDGNEFKSDLLEGIYPVIE